MGGGTSGATPFAAGGAGRIVLEARRILGDNQTGIDKGIVAKGPAGRVKKGPLADGKFTMVELKGTAELPDRSDTDAYFEMDRQAREALHQVFRGTP